MTIVRLSKRKYTHPIYGRGIYGRYSKVRMQNGYGIIDSAASFALGGLGRKAGKAGGKKLAKFIQDKTGSELLGSISKSALGALGGFAGEKLGKHATKLIGNALSGPEKEKEKKKKESEKISLNQLLDSARNKIQNVHSDIMGAKGMQTARGIQMYY